ncbi:hypothetical protein GH742_12035 [Legionella sp. MW5194]|uniref:C2 family cysteine protease n=1 Tax=Legionella sp. MW5194 TaxID=2662448 RepID=UPI00193CF86D|nr:C2 family cysteine protease [Legionella sp. MW5194]QRN04543.1 hypothetical protein GH742_12035 [Legionella sp. MW5194]
MPVGSTLYGQACPVNNPVSESTFSLSHTPYVDALYPEKLKLSDVAQGGRTGDCYFLSVLNAILTLPHGEEWIRQRMVERDGRIHVLFFRYEKPEWVVIEKSLPQATGVLSSGPAWVRFWEKAYVAFNGGNYKVLSQGDSRQVFRALLGDKGMAIATSVQSRKPLAELYQCSIEGCSGCDIYTLMFLLRPYDAQTSVGNVVKQVFHHDKALLKAWWAWVARNQDKWRQLLAKESILYHETLIDFIEKEKQRSDNPPVEAISAVKNWLVDWCILPCKMGYSQDELRLYDELKQAFDEESPVVASPSAHPPSGIIIEHTYAVIGLRQSELSHRKFVILRNPYPENRSWFFKLVAAGGRASREWENSETGAVEFKISTTDHCTFEMELHDFAHAFLYIDKGLSLKTTLELQHDCDVTSYGY